MRNEFNSKNGNDRDNQPNPGQPNSNPHPDQDVPQ